MGYRNYIGTMPKKEYNKIKSLAKEEVYKRYNTTSDFEDEEPHLPPYELTRELYEFGKYVDFEPPKNSMKPFFKKKGTQKRWEHYEFKVVTKEFLAYIISNYTEKVKRYYFELLKGFDANNKETWTNENCVKLWEHTRSMSAEWNYLTPYNLEKGDAITTSWKYEYGIFELVRIYKSFDWKRNVMVYYGY